MERESEITDELVKKTIASGKQYCVRLYKAGPNRNQPEAEAERIQKEHLRYLLQLKAEGKLLVNGPVIDDPVLKGVSIFATTDKKEVKRLSDGDPAVKVGVYQPRHARPRMTTAKTRTRKASRTRPAEKRTRNKTRKVRVLTNWSSGSTREHASAAKGRI